MDNPKRDAAQRYIGPPPERGRRRAERAGGGLRRQRLRKLVGRGPPPCPPPSRGRVYAHLHSWPTRSRACASPLSENVSVDCVPLAETPLTTALWPARMASTICASSAAFLIQAPSCWV